jgi:hypothetical protein
VIKLKRIIILLLALTVFALLCGCTQRVSISGTVIDFTTQAEIPAKITVTVYANNNTYTRSESTDSEGNFSMGLRLYGDIDGIEFAAEAAEYQTSSLKLNSKVIPDNIIIKFLLERI